MTPQEQRDAEDTKRADAVANTQEPAGQGEYLIAVADPERGPVDCWSSVRLSFEPQGWVRSMRDELGDAARSLVAARGDVLHGTYTSLVRDLADAENVLFYNVGPGRFQGAARGGLSFERVYADCAAPTCPCAFAPRHHVHYDLVTAGAPFQHWTTGEVLARWTDAPTPPLHEFARLSAIWLALRRSRLETFRRLAPPEAPFALRIRVSRGQGAAGAGHVAAMVKPLLDAVVSALHVHDGRDVMDLSRRVAGGHGEIADEVARLLMDDTHAVLGVRRLLWPWRDSVQWNPADEGCVAAEVVLENSRAGDGRWTHSGELLEALPRP